MATRHTAWRYQGYSNADFSSISYFLLLFMSANCWFFDHPDQTNSPLDIFVACCRVPCHFNWFSACFKLPLLPLATAQIHVYLGSQDIAHHSCKMVWDLLLCKMRSCAILLTANAYNSIPVDCITSKTLQSCNIMYIICLAFILFGWLWATGGAIVWNWM